ncbi:maleylacetoacetate isomerase [Oceanisphaera arctica]|uniref:Maleylacetoacetate isomerase n=1 Tax=Oceanisphaera arctica TaxID=641510 RepID=A0A2P5TMW7_9GAMM|nr:maleylacetoacetate isomerase [Oceanisphaera arctica]PPL16777.1 maleylacetoacetate isomerase [Oceanisphaera arctica]GHA05837.1 maleylacetoacetate isomerase [Oceanisphaera arctica]
MKLYDYVRSSAAYRVRIALNLKGLVYESVPISLLEGTQLGEDYRALNPTGLVPSLAIDDQGSGEGILGQSLAIIEYLDECYPEPALMPATPLKRARTRALALQIACDIHPLNNLRVLKYLTGELELSEEQKTTWYHHWLKQGLSPLEQQLGGDDSRYCCGDTPTLADICLVPQLYNARRFKLDLTPYARLVAIDQACNQLTEFRQAHPDQQPSHPGENLTRR